MSLKIFIIKLETKAQEKIKRTPIFFVPGLWRVEYKHIYTHGALPDFFNIQNVFKANTAPTRFTPSRSPPASVHFGLLTQVQILCSNPTFGESFHQRDIPVPVLISSGWLNTSIESV